FTSYRFLSRSLLRTSASSIRLLNSPYPWGPVLSNLNGCGPSSNPPCCSALPNDDAVLGVRDSRSCLPSSTLYHFTSATSTSTWSVPKNHPLQNQSRSIPDTSSMVRKKSAGLGCLKAQRFAYSLNALSNSSSPSTVSRRIVSAAAGLK